MSFIEHCFSGRVAGVLAIRLSRVHRDGGRIRIPELSQRRARDLRNQGRRGRASGDDGRLVALRAGHGSASGRRPRRHRARAAPGPLEAPSSMSALDLPLREQAAQIASGELDSGELLDACLARIEERNPDLNAVIATFPDRSREMLEKAPDGPLRGVPVLIKDEWPLPWRAQTFGAPPEHLNAKAGESGPYRALRDAGSVIA